MKSIFIDRPLVTQTTISSFLLSLTLTGFTEIVVPVFVTSTTLTFTFRLSIGAGVGCAVCAPRFRAGKTRDETRAKVQNHRELAG